MMWLLVYLLAVNVLLFALMGIDKYKAVHGKWRIREATLFLLAAVGGSAGGILGMRDFHHKTLHRSFRYGFPAILLAQLALAAWLIYRHFI